MLHRVVYFVIFLVSSFLASGLTHAQVPTPEVAGKSWLLLDVNSGQVIVSKEADTPVEPASLTKLMTAYLTFAALKQGVLKMEQTIPVSEAAYKATGSRMFIEPNRPVTVNELLHGMIIQSGNDASIALAEAVGGSEAGFAQMMNTEAQRMGLTKTRFMNATGLPDPQHLTTARDLSVLATRLITDFPEYYPLYSQREYAYNSIKQPNRNRLLWIDPHVDGLKTGHTEAAGYCLIASAKRNERRLLSVVLGTSSDTARAQESLKLLNHGFQYYETLKLYEKQQVVSTPRLWKGDKNTVKIGFQQDRYATLPRGMGSRLKAQLKMRQPLLAPLQAGQTVGNLEITVDGKTLQTLPVVALEDVPQAGIFGRAWDAMRLWMQ